MREYLRAGSDQLPYNRVTRRVLGKTAGGQVRAQFRACRQAGALSRGDDGIPLICWSLGEKETAGALKAPADCSILSLRSFVFSAGLAHQLCLELPRPLDRRDHLIGRNRRSFGGDARFLLDPIRCGIFHACKPLQGLFHFFLAAPSGHPGYREYQLLARSHFTLLLVSVSCTFDEF